MERALSKDQCVASNCPCWHVECLGDLARVGFFIVGPLESALCFGLHGRGSLDKLWKTCGLTNIRVRRDAHLKRSLVLGFAYPKAQLAELIPPCLSLDLYEDEWAFVAVAMVETKNLRPHGFPKLLGKGFFLIGYRVMVRYRGDDGRSLRGLYILGS